MDTRIEIDITDPTNAAILAAWARAEDAARPLQTEIERLREFEDAARLAWARCDDVRAALLAVNGLRDARYRQPGPGPRAEDGFVEFEGPRPIAERALTAFRAANAAHPLAAIAQSLGAGLPPWCTICGKPLAEGELCPCSDAEGDLAPDGRCIGCHGPAPAGAFRCPACDRPVAAERVDDGAELEPDPAVPVAIDRARCAAMRTVLEAARLRDEADAGIAAAVDIVTSVADLLDTVDWLFCATVGMPPAAAAIASRAIAAGDHPLVVGAAARAIVADPVNLACAAALFGSPSADDQS